MIYAVPPVTLTPAIVWVARPQVAPIPDTRLRPRRHGFSEKPWVSWPRPVAGALVFLPRLDRLTLSLPRGRPPGMDAASGVPRRMRWLALGGHGRHGAG